MRIVDRYIGIEFLKALLYSITVFVAIYCIVDLFDRMGRYLDAPARVVAQYYLYRIPGIGLQVMPVAVLLASLVSLGNLARHNELLALKMARVSTLRIVAPLLLLSLLGSVLILFLSESLIPEMNERALNVFRSKVQKTPAFQRTREHDIWYRATGNRFLHISLMESASGMVQGFTLFELSPEFQLIQRIDAREARWRDGHWQLTDGSVSTTRPDGTYEAEAFTTMRLELEEKPSDLARVVRESQEMNSDELRDYIDRLVKSGVNSLRYQVDLAVKSAMPFVTLVMTLIGIAFALRTGKGGVIAWAGACVLVAVCYWIVFSLSISVGRGGVVPPFLAAWLPNAIFAGAGLTSLLTLKN